MAGSEKGRDEVSRLESTRRHQVLDTDAEVVFDEIADLAAAICEAPMAAISFVDEDRVWFKARLGVNAREISREISFCTHAILQEQLFVVPDASQDDRFKNNPLVATDPKIRFYAGAQLLDKEGYPLGTLCVLDRRPRELSSSQRRALKALAQLVMTELELRRSADQLRRLEVEAANLRLVRAMASRLLHEIGNAVVPLSTHQQLLAERYDDPEFRASLEAALAEAVRRCFRLIRQVRHFAQVREPTLRPVSLRTVLEQAYKTAVESQGDKPARLRLETNSDPILVNADFAALTDAFSEVILNALQANPSDPAVDIHCRVRSLRSSPGEVVIDFYDSGKGFPPEAVKNATRLFYTTRSVGPGLGLSVAHRVIEQHHGILEILGPAPGEPSGVRILLPLSPRPETVVASDAPSV